MVSGTEVEIRWTGRPARAWVPARLRDRDLTLSVGAIRRTEQAVAAVRRVQDLLPRRWEPVARLLLRSEGVASSQIEGVRAPVELVAAAEIDPTVDVTAAAVAANLAVVRDALATADGPPLTVATCTSGAAVSPNAERTRPPTGSSRSSRRIR